MTTTIFRAALLSLGLIVALPAGAAQAAEMDTASDLGKLQQTDINRAQRPAPSGSTTEILSNSNTYPKRAQFPALSHNKIYAHSVRPRRGKPTGKRRRAR